MATMRAAYTFDEARALLGGVSRTTLYKRIDEGLIKTFHIGRRHLIAAEEIDSLIARATTPPPQAQEDPAEAAMRAAAPSMYAVLLQILESGAPLGGALRGSVLIAVRQAEGRDERAPGRPRVRPRGETAARRRWRAGPSSTATTPA